MKKYISIAIIALVTLGAVSCADFLDVQSQGYPTQDQFFLTDQQSIDAIDACYARIPQEGFLGRDAYWEQACANDIVWGRNRSYNTLATLSYTGDESPLRSIFGYAYTQGMNRCNWVIVSLLNKQGKATLTEVETRSLGEAYFLRAYWHWIIAYRYGTKDLGVPFVAYETVEGGYNNEIPEQQASVMENYRLIVSDLEKAEALLPKFEEYDAADRGRVHKASAAALMAKTYAYWAAWDVARWPDVITCVDRLENSYGRDLAPVFTDLFSPDWEKGFHNKEICWNFPSNGGDDGAGGGSIEFPGVCLENKAWGIFNGWGQFKPSYDIYEEMLKDGKGNIRLTASILEYGQEFQFFGETRRFYSATDIEAGFMINKWMQAYAPADCMTNGWACSNENWPCTRVNWPIVRFGDCLLLRAEAYLATGQAGKATTDIGRIRSRSGLAPLPGTATWADLYHERRCELAFEMAADHAFDCKRWAISSFKEIKDLAIAELNAHPRVRHYEDRSNPDSPFKVGDYEDYLSPVKVWSDKFVTFPYPSEQVNKSAGALRNVPAWQ